MPMPDYRNGAPWWRIENEDGMAVMALPKRNALTEIYTSNAWYGLIPDERLIDPAGIVRAAAIEEGDDRDLRHIFSISARDATEFQTSISRRYHVLTYVLYGDGDVVIEANETDKSDKPDKLLTFGTVRWKGCLPRGTTEKDLQDAFLLNDDHRGTLTISVGGQTVVLTVQPPDESGDGTVPISSSAAQEGKRGVQQTFRQSGFDHQNCFNHPSPRWATLYTIAKIAQTIPVEESCATK